MTGFSTEPVQTGRPTTSAITWIDRRKAIVARTTREGLIHVDEIDRNADTGGNLEEESQFLARVADKIGVPDQVVVVGPGSMRTQLEREYVTIYHRPDRLIDVEPAREVAPVDLAARLRAFAR